MEHSRAIDFVAQIKNRGLHAIKYVKRDAEEANVLCLKKSKSLLKENFLWPWVLSEIAYKHGHLDENSLCPENKEWETRCVIGQQNIQGTIKQANSGKGQNPKNKTKNPTTEGAYMPVKAVFAG